LNKSDREISFVVDDMTPAFANSLRRIAIGEVPVLAVDSVDFYENNSMFYDEMVAHRLSLVPLVFNPKNYIFKEDCKCEGKGCSNCQAVLVIDKKGPSVVYTKDIKSSDNEVKPLFDEIPLLELRDKQSFKAEGSAILGLGKDHAKFQASKTGFRYYPVVKVNKTVTNSEVCMRVCPRNALKIDGSKASVTTDCDLCKECVRACEPEGAIEISGNPAKMIFTVESISGLTAEQIMISALDILKKKAKEFEKAVKKL